jgi:hypothetical protein
MEHRDLDAKALHRLTELACLVDAIPGRFRTSIMEAALGTIQPAVDWQDSPLVQSLRFQIQDCVDDCVGFCLDDYAWRNVDLSGLRSACKLLSAISAPVEVELVVSQIVSRVAQTMLSTVREAQP